MDTINPRLVRDARLPLRSCLFVLTLALLPAACVAPPPPLPASPDWVRGSDRNFPEDRLLLARASARSDAEAQDKARADLARPFVLRVESASVTGLPAGKDGTRRLVALSEKIIEQIRVAARWQDPVTKVYHALASLPRDVAADSLREAIIQRDELVHRAASRAAGNGDLLGRLRQLDQALDMQIERDALNRLRSTVVSRSTTTESPWTVDRLREAHDKLFAEVRLVPEVAPGSVPGIEPVLMQVLGDLGLRAISAQEANYRLSMRLVMEDDPGRGDRVQRRGILEVVLIEQAGSRIIGTRRWLIYSEGPDRAAANRSALVETGRLLSRHLRRFMLESANR